LLHYQYNNNARILPFLRYSVSVVDWWRLLANGCVAGCTVKMLDWACNAFTARCSA